MNRLIIGTKNAGKVIEIRSALGEIVGWTLEPIFSDIPGIEETGETFLANARTEGAALQPVC
jgi:inosine/xanthosine triphosphate pyrophosphatase family protein